MQSSSGKSLKPTTSITNTNPSSSRESVQLITSDFGVRIKRQCNVCELMMRLSCIFCGMQLRPERHGRPDNILVAGKPSVMETD